MDLYLNQFNMTIEEQYEKAASTPSDINEHIPVIRKYAAQCETVIECGVRACVSTWALLASKPISYIGVDLHEHSNVKEAYQAALDSNIRFNFIKGDTTKVELPKSDLLLIDTLHRYSCIKKELARHGNNTKKFIIFHDTESYKYVPENGEWLTPEELSNAEDGDTGIWPAIQEFLIDNPHWSIAEHFINNNGLTILKRLW